MLNLGEKIETVATVAKLVNQGSWTQLTAEQGHMPHKMTHKEHSEMSSESIVARAWAIAAKPVIAVDPDERALKRATQKVKRICKKNPNKINGKVAYKRCSIQKDWVVQSIDLSPHATKKINIVFEAKSGKASAAKGTIELDDIAISGKCTYLCMYDDFDTQGLKKWNTSSTDIANI